MKIFELKEEIFCSSLTKYHCDELFGVYVTATVGETLKEKKKKKKYF